VQLDKTRQTEEVIPRLLRTATNYVLLRAKMARSAERAGRRQWGVVMHYALHLHLHLQEDAGTHDNVVTVWRIGQGW
jgi:hypothetical protein